MSGVWNGALNQSPTKLTNVEVLEVPPSGKKAIRAEEHILGYNETRKNNIQHTAQRINKKG